MLLSLLLILPVFLVIALGVVLDIFSVLPKQTGSIIGAYVLYAALPILMVHILAGSALEDILHGGFWAAILLAQVAIYAVGYCGELLLGKRGHGKAAIIALSGSCCNVAFLGLPVVMNLLPGNKEALVAAGLAVITPNVVSIPCQVQLEYLKLSGKASKGAFSRLARAVLLNPLMLGTFAGFALCVTGLGLWGPLDKAAAMVGNTTAPCMLLALGLDLRDRLRVAFSGDKRFGYFRLAATTLLKLVVNPLLAWALLLLFGVTGTWLAVGVIMCGSATALLTYVLAEIYGQVPEEAAMIAVTTNVLNLATLTVLSALLRAQGLLQ
ncbi:MAG TPA: AEC family transporter [Solidesulfovibrio sp.]|jgi:malonate transporter|nr:transporter [Desulfovibrio sp.]HML62824.1 AEC family transporter [Solidesulfovibrio sp.]